MIIKDNEIMNQLLSEYEKYDKLTQQFIDYKINEISLAFFRAANYKLCMTKPEFYIFTQHYHYYDDKSYIVFCMSQLREFLKNDNFIGLCENILTLYDECYSDQYHLCQLKKTCDK
jgi:hypothetical protein